MDDDKIIVESGLRLFRLLMQHEALRTLDDA